jgi:diguanylate cyclase (GGDEF)-like protein
MRMGSSLSVIAFDIDHFKRFNDMHGHDAGDAVLVSVAAELWRWLRDSDIACRTGGEEFLLVLPEAAVVTARERAEEIRAAISDLVVESRGQELPHVNRSLGVAGLPDDARKEETLLQSADEAL